MLQATPAPRSAWRTRPSATRTQRTSFSTATWVSKGPRTTSWSTRHWTNANACPSASHWSTKSSWSRRTTRRIWPITWPSLHWKFSSKTTSSCHWSVSNCMELWTFWLIAVRFNSLSSISAEIYPTTQFPVPGGLLGLFVGVSVLSIVEIFYYFVLRWKANDTASLQSAEQTFPLISRLACILRNPPEDDDEDDKDEKDGEEKVRHLPLGQPPTIAAIEAPPLDPEPPKYSKDALERY